MINKLAKEAYENAVSKGFYDNNPSFAMRIALMHSELSEALEADRKGSYAKVSVESRDILNNIQEEALFVREYKSKIKETVEEEMADIVIRVMDLCAREGIDLESHIKWKMMYNSTRPKMHGKKY